MYYTDSDIYLSIYLSIYIYIYVDDELNIIHEHTLVKIVRSAHSIRRGTVATVVRVSPSHHVALRGQRRKGPCRGHQLLDAQRRDEGTWDKLAAF